MTYDRDIYFMNITTYILSSKNQWAEISEIYRPGWFLLLPSALWEVLETQQKNGEHKKKNNLCCEAFLAYSHQKKKKKKNFQTYQTLPKTNDLTTYSSLKNESGFATCVLDHRHIAYQNIHIWCRHFLTSVSEKPCELRIFKEKTSFPRSMSHQIYQEKKRSQEWEHSVMWMRRLHITVSPPLRNITICGKSLVIKQSMRDSELLSYNSPESGGKEKLYRNEN